MRATSLATLVLLSVVLHPTVASADPLGWPQPAGAGSDVVLTYSFSNLFDGGFNSQLSAAEMRLATATAFAIWSRYAPLHFFEVRDSGPPPSEFEYRAQGHPDIRIGYESMLAGSSAAHAHLPYEPTVRRSGLAGDVHFSNDVSVFGTTTWGAAANGALQLDFFSAMLHEIGHSLGLLHFPDSGAVMGNVFLVFQRMEFADLQPGDIAAIRALYGSGVGSAHALGPEFIPNPPIPEPGTLVLIGSGLGLLAGLRKRPSSRSRQTAGRW